MKKLVKLLVASLVCMSLVACGSKTTDEGTTTDQGTTTTGGTLVVYQNKAEVTDPLQRFADKWGEENGVTVEVKTCTGTCDYGAGMKSDMAAGETPDIFIIEGDTGYELYKNIMEPLDDQSWVADTDYAYEKDGHVYGMPVAVEGYGLAYNKDILDAVGVDPTTLTTLSAYKDAFEKIDAKKDELGLTAVVALPTADGMYWIMGNHDFAAYLSSGLDYYDTSVIDMTLKGEVDADRLATYADWVELLYQYTDEKMLISSTNDDQMYQFGAGKYAFMHQGTWAEQPVAEAGGDFAMGFAPYAPLGDVETNGLFAGAPSWYCVNKDSANLDVAKKFLVDLAGEEGQKMYVEEINLISAFKTCKTKPTTPLAGALSDWIEAGGTAYSFTNQYKTPDGFNMNQLGPIYNQFASGSIDKQQFIDLFTAAIATLGK